MARKGKGDSKRRKEKAEKSAERIVSHVANHPIRLDAYLTTFEALASPNEVAKLLKKPLASASFHITELKKAGVIELMKTVPRRGAVEHFYRAVKPPEIGTEEWEKMPRSARRRVLTIGVSVVVADILSALRHRKLESDDRMYLVWMPMRLNAKGKQAMDELQAEMLERMKAISGDFAADENDAEVPTRVAVSLWFERGQGGIRRPRDIPGLENLE
ncbi:MAG: hypothetical protein WDZ46_08475 [Solirubrobacterales bacterium]